MDNITRRTMTLSVYLQHTVHRARQLGQQYPFCCFLLLPLLVSTLLLSRYITIIMAFLSFLAGVISFYFSVGAASLHPNMFAPIKPKATKTYELELFPLGHSCIVCGEIKCKRHRSTLLLENYQPWFDLKIPSKVDESVSEILELVLEKFIYPWYKGITDDEAFVDELRVSLRFLAAVMVRRTQKVDVSSLITQKLLKVSINHIETIRKASQRVNNVEDLQQAALEEYGPDLHVALRSRSEELLYLRKLTQVVLPYVLPPKATDCRSLTLLIREVIAGSVFLPFMDYMADPDTVNHLIVKFIHKIPIKKATEPTSPFVPFLEKYSNARNKKLSVLKLELKEIREQQDLLFSFMNFLEQEGAIHVLLFYLSIEEFNNRILCPELSNSEKKILHAQIKKIYKTYCLDESIDKIRFNHFIVEEMRVIAEGPYAEVVKLQKMRCLYEAYEYIMFLLENVFIPMYCDSDEYLSQLLRGAESTKRDIKMNKDKEMLETSLLDQDMNPLYGITEEEDDLVEGAMMALKDDSLMETTSTSSLPRDLSAWNITIPYIDFIHEDKNSEQTTVFCINVECKDRKAVGHEVENWTAYRKYADFYILQTKLTEFHGSLPNTKLPSKRITCPKNFEYLNSKREDFQDYLQKLQQHPYLSKSQLLNDFLSPKSNFQNKTSSLPSMNFGKILRSVPSKMVKEKGKHLDPFIQSFFNSCKSPKSKPIHCEFPIQSPNLQTDKNFFNDLFIQNVNQSEMMEKRRNQNYSLETHTLEGVYDYLMYLGQVVFHIPDWLHHLLIGSRIFFKNILESYIDDYLQYRLNQELQEDQLVAGINLLRVRLFNERKSISSVEQRERRAIKTFEVLMRYFPYVLSKCIAEEDKCEGVRLLFDGVQQPVLNKQLTYVMLDIVILELFPELNK